MTKLRSVSSVAVVAASCWATGVAPASAQGQALGFGPRFSFVRGDVTAETATRYSGAFLRMRASDRTSIEIALDYRSVINDDLTERIKDYPIPGLGDLQKRLKPSHQGSMWTTGISVYF